MSLVIYLLRWRQGRIIYNRLQAEVCTYIYHVCLCNFMPLCYSASIYKFKHDLQKLVYFLFICSMLHIVSSTPVQWWLDCFTTLLDQEDLNEWWHWKDEKLCLQLFDPFSSESYHSDFPMSEETMNQYNNYIVHGKWPRDLVQDEHAIYYERLYNYGGINQIQYIIDTLKENPTRRRAIAFWPQNEVDTESQIYPCLIYIRCIVRQWKLNFDIHFRGNDVYKKILMDINLWVWLMKVISDGLDIEPWVYTHIVNTAHFYEEDKSEILDIYKKLNSSNI